MHFRIPFLHSSPRHRHSFGRLRSFHLVLEHTSSLPSTKDEVQAPVGSTKSNDFKPELKLKRRSLAERASRLFTPIRAVDGIIPVPPIFYFGLAVLCSVIFVITIPSVFHGVTAQDSLFKPILNEIAQTNPGLVLLGENVDIDVDEPAVTIRWSIVACGEAYMLPGSAGIHGSTVCGLPNCALQIYVDGDPEAAGIYDPGLIPYNGSGERRKIQNLVQFDSDHVLDVHNDRLYPFDTYFLSSTLRALSQNKSVPFSKLATLDLTSAFVVETVDIESYETNANGTSTPSRDIDMNIRRPLEARIIALLLWASSWFLTHICIGNVILARRTRDTRPILKMLIVNGATVVGLPQLRNAFPDAPDMDGVLIDTIGFFPQMILAGLTVVILLLTIYARELDRLDRPPSFHYSSGESVFWSKRSRQHPNPPPEPLPPPTSTDIALYNKTRMAKHLKGEFVFPPVQILPSVQEEPAKSPAAHRRFKTAVNSPLRSKFEV